MFNSIFFRFIDTLTSYNSKMYLWKEKQPKQNHEIFYEKSEDYKSILSSCIEKCQPNGSVVIIRNNVLHSIFDKRKNHQNH